MKQHHLILDITAAALVIFVLILLLVWVMPDYLTRNAEPAPTPIPGVERVNEQGMTNMPCLLTVKGC